MSILRLRLNLGLEGIPKFGVISNIYDLSNRRKGKRDMVIHLGDYDEYHDVDLEPGHYFIEIVLPSGQIINNEVSVGESDEPQELYLYAEASPHEWLGWQQFIGNVNQQNYEFSQTKPANQIKAELVSISVPLNAGYDPMRVSDFNTLVSQGYFFSFPSLKTFSLSKSISDLFPFESLNPEIYVATRLLVPDRFDYLSEVHLFEPPYFGEGFNKRYYMFIQGADIPTQYCILPIPWMDLYNEQDAVVEALIYHDVVESSKIDSGHRLSVVVRDNLLGSILGYLSSGNLSSAAKIMEKYNAKQMLFYKIKNPIAAAAGAYVLLNIEPGQYQDWHEWVYNLMYRFQWLPDGAIQHAWTILNKHNLSKNEKKKARTSLLEGYRRGIPFYTKGVSLLLDGLRMLANDSRAISEWDPEVEGALDLVWQLASRINIRQPFTTVIVR